MSLFWLAVLFIVISIAIGIMNDDGDLGGKVFVFLMIVWFGTLIYRYNTDEESGQRTRSRGSRESCPASCK